MTSIWPALCLLLCFALLAANARAARVTIDPDDFPIGSDISLAFPGVTLSAFGSGELNGPNVSTPQVFSRSSPHASTGNRVFGNSSYSNLWFSDSAEFRADFAKPAKFVSLDLIADDGFDPSMILAYAESGALLAEATVSGAAGVGVAQTASIDRPSADIAYVIATNPADFLGQQFLIDRLVFESRSTSAAARLILTERAEVAIWNSAARAIENVVVVPEPESAGLAAGASLLFAPYSVRFLFLLHRRAKTVEEL